ncbi:hypothetical protein J6590_071307 [Homalodisca vitripennis]|nr:hypothetical protein J6590_071307 [Homalodisca vitripennis]
MPKTYGFKSHHEAVKPYMIQQYNLYMDGVDMKDKSIYHISCSQTTTHYWKKIFYNFLDMAIFDSKGGSYIQKNTDKPMPRRKFVMVLIDEPTRRAPEEVAPQPTPTSEAMAPRKKIKDKDAIEKKREQKN